MPARLRRVEDRLLMPPSESVRHWVRLCDQLLRRELWFRVFRDRWCDLADVEAGGIVEGVSLLVTGEDDAHWLVSYEDIFKHPDPPVHRYVLDEETSQFVHDALVSPAVSEWALTHVLQNLRGSGSQGFQGTDDRAIDEIATRFARRLDFSGCVVLEDRDMLVVITRGENQRVTAHARSPEAMETLRKRFPWAPNAWW